MLEQSFQEIYAKFELHFYQKVFRHFETREATLTTVESYCMAVINALGSPTIAEFSRMVEISTPNAAYKVSKLVAKGYVDKIQSTEDKREYHLRPTQKYYDYYNISNAYVHEVLDRARAHFSEEDILKLDSMLTIISRDLMPEIQLPCDKNPDEDKS